MIKQLLIKLGLWEEKNNDYPGRDMIVSSDWFREMSKHYCVPCKRWFSDVRGKLMHDRHRHKNI